ncbi:MAG: hypothetical protein JWM10_668, partial [Myxococcaceae bacterium]|nr:hypothetical protein [Myxococcaceae bacterium]
MLNVLAQGSGARLWGAATALLWVAGGCASRQISPPDAAIDAPDATDVVDASPGRDVADAGDAADVSPARDVPD